MYMKVGEGNWCFTLRLYHGNVYDHTHMMKVITKCINNHLSARSDNEE